MTGFAGFYDHGRHALAIEDIVRQMVCDDAPHVAMDDRGGFCIAGQDGIIVEQSADLRWLAMLDGDVFNCQDLKNRLNQSPSAALSPLAIILEAVSRWGVQATLDRLDGAFALCLWDRGERTLYLSCDRGGEKSIYWMQQGQNIAFAHSIRSLRRSHIGGLSTDVRALGQYMHLGWLPAPLTPFSEIRRLPPGYVLVVQRGDVSMIAACRDLGRVSSPTGSFAGGGAAAAERLNLLLRSAIAVRTMTDKEPAIFLANSVPDMALAAILRHMVSGPVHSYTLRYGDDVGTGRDGVPAVADHLGLDHTEIRVLDSDVAGWVQPLVTGQDSLNGTAARLHHHLLAQAAGRGQSIISSAGALELFAGHERYTTLPARWQHQAHMPEIIRQIRSLIERWRPGHAKGRIIPGLARSLLDLLLLDFGSCGDLMAQPQALDMPERLRHAALTGIEPARCLMIADLLCLISDNVCPALAESALNQGLLMRFPMLDRHVVAFALSLPLKGFESEPLWPLPDVLARYVPPDMVPTDRMGERAGRTNPPIGQWLRGPLRQWAWDMLSADRLTRQGLLKPSSVANRWQSVLAGRDHAQWDVWRVLMLQAWMEHSGS